MKKLRFYVASRFENKDEVRSIQKLLIDKGYELSYNWCDHEGIDDHKKKEYGIADIAGVRQSDFLVVCWPGFTGTKLEIGAALAVRIPVYILGCKGPDQMESDGRGTSVFWHHPLINFCGDTDELIDRIESYQII